MRSAVPFGIFLVALSVGVALAAPLAIAVKAATAARDPSIDQPVLSIVLTPESTKAFADFTAAHVGETVVIRVGGETVLSATVREPITGGEINVSGDFTAEKVRELAARISSGAAKIEVDTSTE